MMFHPQVHEELIVKGRTFIFNAQPNQPDVVCALSGTDSIVYRLEAGDHSLHALKVFHEPAQFPDEVNRSKALAEVAGITVGLDAARRFVIEPRSQATLLEEYPGLLNAIIMPWIPGKSWRELMCAGTLSVEQSMKYAQSLAHVLKSLETCGLAHCSLGRDHILAGKDEVTYLVDLEDMFLPNIAHPVRAPSPPASYRHPQTGSSPEGDRFAAAILFAECLCWSDERIVNAAFDADGFFDPQELQQDSPRFKLLVKALEDKHGTAFRQAFEQAWFSKTLADCPSLSTWSELMGLHPRFAQPSLKSITFQPSSKSDSVSIGQFGDLGPQLAGKRPILNRVVSAVALVAILLLAVGLGYSVYEMDRVKNSLERAEATIDEQANTILDYNDQLKQAKSTIDEQGVNLNKLKTDLSNAQASLSDYRSQTSTLNDQINGLKADLSSANSKISDLESNQPIRLTIVNEFGQPQYVGIDSVAFIYIPTQSSESFYLKPGFYTLMSCHPTRMNDHGSCTKWGDYDLTRDRTVTIHK